MSERKRVAVVVFADVDWDGQGSGHLVERALHEILTFDGTEYPVRVGGDAGREVNVRFHDVMEAGAAIGNGYLWTQPTSKAFRLGEVQG